MVFVNKLDRAGSDFEAALRDLQAQLSDRTLLRIRRPVHEGTGDADTVWDADALENAVMLTGDEALLERYLAGDPPDFPQTVCAAVENGAVPVLCGS